MDSCGTPESIVAQSETFPVGTTACFLPRQHSKSIFKEMPSAPTEFEDMLEIIEATSTSLVSGKKKVSTPGFTLEL
ncbi:hypothetical protein Trydic_g22422 [Trypoxylus dichotomus]